MSQHSLYTAVEDFRRARRRASLQHIMSRLTGRSDELLSYEDARRKLRGMESANQHLEEVPLDAIVGTVGRYSDFNRSFLPRRDINEQRWARVKLQMTDLAGVPPIEVYRIGQAYFVKDGHHRVSVARQLGTEYIEAYVTDVHTKVPLSRDVRPDDLILKAEYAAFLAETGIDELRPGADLTVTVPGQYRLLKEHIAVHRYFMGLDQKRDIPYAKAVTHWYDEVYIPVVRAIRERGILRDFPDRTETDLYLWISEHRAALEHELGWQIEPADAATDLAARSGRTLRRVIARITDRVMSLATPDELADGPSPGTWRREHLPAHRAERLFLDILVPIGSERAGWSALDQALEIARREGGSLHGLHVVRSVAAQDSPATQAIKDEFDRRCAAAGIPGSLTVETGRISYRICEQARWADLVVTNLAYPPPPRWLARLGSGFRTMVRRCPRPVLAVPGTCSSMSRALLAYDGSPKAEEALFVATYLAGHWATPLVVVTVPEHGRTTSTTCTRAERYLQDHGVQATFVSQTGNVAEVILHTAEEQHCDLLIMGGYGFTPLLEAMLGSSVDQVLRESHQPILICR